VHLEKVLNAFSEIDKQLNISGKYNH